MKLESATIYDAGAVLVWAETVDIDDTLRAELVIPDCPGCIPSDSRPTITIDHAVPDTTDAAVLESNFETHEAISQGVLPNNEHLKKPFEEFKEALKNRDVAAAELAHYEAESENIDKLIQNTVDPKTVSGKSPNNIVECVQDIVKSARKAKADIFLNSMSAKERLMELESILDAKRKTFQDALSLVETRPHYGGGHQKDELAKWYHELYSPDVRTVHDCKATFTANAPTKLHLKIEYFVEAISWTPTYDFHFSGEGLQKCDVNFIVEISQNCGADLSGVPINLASGDPRKSQEPCLNRKRYVNIVDNENDNDTGVIPCSLDAMDCAMVGGRSSLEMGNVRLQLPPTNDLKPRKTKYRLPFKTLTLFGQLYHHVIVKHKLVAYRCAYLKNTADTTLFPTSSVNLYIAENLVGTHQISDTIGVGQDFVLYLGPDEMVQVTELGSNKFQSKGGNFLKGNTKKQAFGEQLEIQNHHSVPVTVIISHSLPESANQDIHVMLKPDMQKVEQVRFPSDVVAIVSKPASVELKNTTTGSFIEKRKVEAGGSTQTLFSYIVESPADRAVKISPVV